MVDRGSAQDLNEAATRFAETLAESYRLVYGQASESAERQHCVDLRPVPRPPGTDEREGRARRRASQSELDAALAAA